VARFICFGELLIRLSAPDRELLLQTPSLRTHVGGAEANVAVSLARFGHNAHMASIVPDNALGQAAIAELRRYGVDTDAIEFGAGRMGLYFLTPGAGSRPSDIVYDRAHSAFASARAQSIDWRALMSGADWLHISGITPALNAALSEKVRAVMHAARAAGVRVSFDANFRAKLWEARGDDPRPVLDALFAEADLLFADTRDIGLVTGERTANADEAAAIAFKRYPNVQRIASTTRSIANADTHDLGGMMHTRAGATRSAPRTLSAIVDRIGGGDAFAAGLLHGVANGDSDQHMLDFAVAAAALKHYIPGDFNLSTVADVDFFLNNSGSDVRR
jgi:2-dehydro-3-deoxygluconokinase